MLAAVLARFLSVLYVRYLMSRAKIREYFFYWLRTEWSARTIDTCIREVAIACFPVLEKLIQKMQKNKLVCFDETSGNEKDLLKWHGQS